MAYADDTTGAAANKDIMQAEIKELEAVSASVGLSLNGTKTQILVLGSKHNELTLVVDGVNVSNVDNLEILGFSVDYRLSFNGYIDRLTVNLRKCLGVLRMLRYRVSPASFATLPTAS